MRNVKRYQIIPYSSEYAVRDEKGQKLVACPTEQEAQEYIEEMQKEEAGASSFAYGGNKHED